MMKTWIIFIALLMFAGCSDNTKTNREYLPGTAMLEGPDIKAQEGDADGKATVMTPPHGAIPRERYVPEKMDLNDADKLKSPKATLTAEELIKYEDAGSQKYNIYCAVCHGDKGDGKSKLVEIAGSSLVTAPPNLLQGKYDAYTDGRLYYVITYGWGLMGNYSNQISDEKDRWAVVDHVRQLQKTGASNKSGSGE